MNRKEKIYLNTEEEIIDELQDGGVVYEDYNNGETKIKYYMYKGVIISDWTKNNNKFINSGSLFVEKNRYYTIHYIIETLKIEVGKFYKTRDGKKVICAYKSKQKGDDRPYFFSSVDKDELFSMWTTENGFCSEDEKENYKRDVVDYWED